MRVSESINKNRNDPITFRHHYHSCTQTKMKLIPIPSSMQQCSKNGSTNHNTFFIIMIVIRAVGSHVILGYGPYESFRINKQKQK